MKVVLDSNFVLVPIQFKVDVFGEIPRLIDEKIEYVVLSPCVDELKALRGREKIAASTMLEFLKKKGVKTANVSGRPDDAIVEYAAKNGAIVCTNDKELRQRLREKGVKTIFLRKKSFLAVN